MEMRVACRFPIPLSACPCKSIKWELRMYYAKLGRRKEAPLSMRGTEQALSHHVATRSVKL